MKLFVSYTVRDKEITVDYLLKIESLLLEIGDVFIDIIHNDSVNKQHRVWTELDSSDYLIFINSKNANKSFWVQNELRKAVELGIPTIKISPIEARFLTKEILLQKIINVRYNKF
jgi:hypothetical protein